MAWKTRPGFLTAIDSDSEPGLAHDRLKDGRESQFHMFLLQELV